MKNATPLISIIIPVYNVEKYLRQCVDSVLAQTYKNLEIILIDDGSVDSSGKICDEYAVQDRRVKVIHQNNQGVYVSRNVGLQVATGEYIGFVDSDDYIKPDMYQILLEETLKNQVDITMCGQFLLKPNGVEAVKFPQKTAYIYPDNATWLKDLMTYPFATQVLWNKLFKKQAIGNIIFNPQLRNSGDCQFLLDLLCKPLRVAFVPQPLYYYVVRDNSITHRYSVRFFAGRYSVWKCAISIANKMYQKENIPWMNVIYREWFIPTAFMLAVFIILQDVNNEYNKEFWEVHSVCYRVQQSPMRRSLRPIHRVWTYCFGKFPAFTRTLLRLPIVRQLAIYYILHR